MRKHGSGFWSPFEYEARNGEVVYRGRADFISRFVGHSPGWVRKRARSTRPHDDGWVVRIISGEPSKRILPIIMTAEKEDDDPIVGTAEEISTLLGITDSAVRRLRKEGRTSRNGWTIRTATQEEIEAING